ncbi:MAG TPA: BamA/TamA family outer membrane protein [Anaeromyxobacter sp.]
MPRRIAALALAAVLAGAAAPPGPDEAAPEAPTVPGPEAVARPAEPPPPGAFSWFALPVLFWLPETRLGYGATSGLHFHLAGAPRTSSLFFVAAYTLNHQGSADVAGDVYLRDGTLLAGRVRLVHFPDAYYGLGPASPTSAKEPYTRRWAQGIFSAELPILRGRLRAGPRLDLRAEDIGELAPGGLLASGTVEGADGFTAVGIGASATWDTRDRPLFARSGSFLQAWYLHYPEAIGRHREFASANVEGRTFIPLGAERVLGAAAFVEQAFGDPPFTLLPKLGSTRFLRGWREGRFRDRLAWAAQTELRIPIWKRITGTAFGALGDVAPDLGALRADTIKVAGGVGLRYRLTPEGANIRLDVAESRAGPEIYVLVLDAF